MFQALSQFISAWRDRRRLKQRLLFSFHDGRRWRFVDPFRAWRGIQNHATFNFETKMGFVDAGDKEETEACINALCEVFSLEKWNEQTREGLTDSEILGVFRYLIEYLDALKKNTSPGPILSSPTGPESSTSPEGQDEATNASSASSATSSEASCDAPAGSLPESKVP